MNVSVVAVVNVGAFAHLLVLISKEIIFYSDLLYSFCYRQVHHFFLSGDRKMQLQCTFIWYKFLMQIILLSLKTV